MPSVASEDITQLRHAWGEGDDSALERLMPLVYPELRRLAHRHMKRERPGHTLQTTALVHEAYERLAGGVHVQWQGRTHFYAVCAQLMRRILVDEARSRTYVKRGGGTRRVVLDEDLAGFEDWRRDLVRVDEALRGLFHVDIRKARIVELRFFGGLTVEETAVVLKISTDTVLRDWKLAKVWLLREMSRKAPHGF